MKIIKVSSAELKEWLNEIEKNVGNWSEVKSRKSHCPYASVHGADTLQRSVLWSTLNELKHLSQHTFTGCIFTQSLFILNQTLFSASHNLLI